MDLRVLRYFVAIAQEETFTGAAQRLNVTQPTLSRQIRELEEELGAELFMRGVRKNTLTEAGLFLLERAREMLALEASTCAAFAQADAGIRGEVAIGGGESRAMRLVATAARKLRQRHPGVKFHIHSGNAEAVALKLDAGVLDFGVFIRPANLEKYEFFRLPMSDTWGLLLRKDSRLASKKYITPADLEKVDLICSAQHMLANELGAWLGSGLDRLKIAATYNLLYNAAQMVLEGLGAALCIDGIADTSDSSLLCFRPLEPAVASGLDFAWKRQRVFSRAAAAFLDLVREEAKNSPKQQD